MHIFAVWWQNIYCVQFKHFNQFDFIFDKTQDLCQIKNKYKK